MSGLWKVAAAAGTTPHPPWQCPSAPTFGQNPFRPMRVSPAILIDDLTGEGEYSLLVHVEPTDSIDPDVQTILPSGIPSIPIEEEGLRDSGDRIERAGTNATGWECHGGWVQ